MNLFTAFIQVDPVISIEFAKLYQRTEFTLKMFILIEEACTTGLYEKIVA